MNRFMLWLRHRDAINIGGEMGFHTVWTRCRPSPRQRQRPHYLCERTAVSTDTPASLTLHVLASDPGVAPRGHADVPGECHTEGADRAVAHTLGDLGDRAFPF